MEDTYERTFAMIKPDAFYRGEVAEVLGRFEDAGFRVAMAYTTEPDEGQVREHYADVAETHGDELMDQLIDYLADEPVMPLVLEGRNSVRKVRSMVGGTEPREAGQGTVRGDLSSYGFDDSREEDVALPNLVHAADSPGSAEREIELWGLEDHAVDYRRPDVDWLQLKSSSYDDLDLEEQRRIEEEHGVDHETAAEMYDSIISRFE